MKFRTTRKEVMTGYNKTIKIGYCDAQTLLEYAEPVAYTAGTYGWNADIYDMGDGVAIVTGYRPFGNTKPSYELIREYELLAKAIDWHTTNYAERKERVEQLLEKFIEEVLSND